MSLPASPPPVPSTVVPLSVVPGAFAFALAFDGCTFAFAVVLAFESLPALPSSPDPEPAPHRVSSGDGDHEYCERWPSQALVAVFEGPQER